MPEDWTHDEVLEVSGTPPEEIEVPEDGEAGSEETYPGFDTPKLGPDDCLIVRPGEEFEVLEAMPRRLHEERALVLCRGELTAVRGRRRDVVRTPSATDVVDQGTPLANRIVLVTIRQRTRAPRTWPLRYVIITNALDELLGWLDHSPPSWDFQVGQIEALCAVARMESQVEVHDSEVEFAQAHPTWSR